MYELAPWDVGDNGGAWNDGEGEDDRIEMPTNDFDRDLVDTEGEDGARSPVRERGEVGW